MKLVELRHGMACISGVYKAGLTASFVFRNMGNGVWVLDSKVLAR